MNIRCRNCGLWHNTRVCPSYGPMFPAPGKGPEDYADLKQQIQNRIAADIVAEHDGTETEEGPVLVNRRRKKKIS